MGWPLRPIADELIDPVLNRGNNRQAVFTAPADFAAFLQALRQTQKRYPFRLYGYGLMTNHFHRLLQPDLGQCISRIVQSLTVAHTWRFHHGQRTSGHVWQGRFQSPVIQDDEHLRTVLRYIGVNPLRAGMVTDLRDYARSSYPTHGLGRIQEWVSECPNWQGLAATPAARHAFWRGLVHAPLTARELASVRRCVTTGRPFGSVAWVETTAQLLGIPLASRPRGRPRKQAEK